MGLRLSVKLAPGIRVSASSRGVRTSLGPRAARAHVGGGRTGLSTGAGPVSYDTSLGGGSSRARASTRSRSAGARPATPQSTAKLDEASSLSAALEAIHTLHRPTFAPAARQVASRPDVPSFENLQSLTRAFAARDISIFKRAERARAREWADGEAQSEHARLSADAAAEQVRLQEELDRQWSDLLDNDQLTVIAALAEAFEDNTANAAPIGVEGATVSLVLLVPDESAVPSRVPSTTPAGNLSVRQMSKTQANETYWSLVCGHVIVTAKEAFAVAPGIGFCAIIAVRLVSAAAAGDSALECICVTRIGRGALAAADQSVGAAELLADVGSNTLVRWKGSAKQVAALDLSDQPGVLAVLAVVDLDALVQEDDGGRALV